MKPEIRIDWIYLNGCPYCRHANAAMESLYAENPSYASIPIRKINAQEEPELADTFDYYHVPVLFYRGEKLYEAKPGDSYAVIYENIRAAFDRVFADA